MAPSLDNFIMSIVIAACGFDSASVDKETKIICMETLVNCLVSTPDPYRKEAVDKCLEQIIKEASNKLLNNNKGGSPNMVACSGLKDNDKFPHKLSKPIRGITEIP